MTISDQAMKAAWREVDIADGTLVPEFIKVIDGWYRERLVLDDIDIPDCVEIMSMSSAIPVAIVCHKEPCHIPRYRTELRWVRSDG